MKRNYWQYLIDSAGNAVEGAKINVFLANTNTYANIQLTESATAYTTTEFTDILTDSDGYFNFWISDETTSPTYGYSVDQKFDITFSKAGYSTGTIEDVQIVWGGGSGEKVKINDDDTTADYLENKLIAGNNINISPSGEQLVVAFEGVADTYKVKISGAGAEDYLPNKLLAGDNLTLQVSGDYYVASGQPSTEVLSFSSTLTAPATASSEFNVSSFCNRVLVYKVSITPTGITLPYDLRIYEKDTFNADDLVYELLEVDPATAFVDRLPFFIRDLDLTSELHIKIVNTDGSEGSFALVITGEKFA